MSLNLNRPGIGKKLKVKFFVQNLRNILILCLIPLLLLGSLSISISQRYTRLDAEQSQEKMLNQYNELIQVVASEMDSLSLSFNTDPKISNRLSNILSKSEYSYEDVEAMFYLNNIIAVPANSKPFIHSVYVYYDNPQMRFLSSREGLVSLQAFRDQGWYQSYVAATDIGGISTEVRSLQENSFQTDPTKVVSLYKFLADRTTGSKEGVIVVNMLPDYFVKSYQSLSEQPDRSFYITDDRNQIIMQSGMAGRDGVLEALSLPKQFDVLQFDSGIYHMIVKKTDRLNWNLISVVPRKSLYTLPYALIVTTCLLSLLALAVCALAALWLTGKNYRQVYGIIRILESADAADAPDTIGKGPNKVHDIYELIVTNILESFVEHKYVKVQLSERLYRMQALEFKALQSQINPHFLYNTLNSIYWKTFQLTNSRNVPSHMIELLSELLQYALDTSAKVVSLREEIVHIRSYVDIQQMRYKDRFTVIWDELESYADCEVLKLVLQPLIENSIQYGMEANPHLLVKVKLRLQGSVLTVTVIDNGGGMDKERLAATRAALAADAEPQRHIGLSNTNKRIMLQYGEACRSKVLSRKGLGTAVTLYFPQ